MTAPLSPAPASSLPAWIAAACRVSAVLIAIVAVIDPAVSSMRQSRPLVAVVATNASRDSAEVARISRVLSHDFTVVPASFPAASGTVVVGSALPVWARTLTGPVVAISPTATSAALAIRRIDVPARAMMNARVSIAAIIEVGANASANTSANASASVSPTATAKPTRALSDSIAVELVFDNVVVSRHQFAPGATPRHSVVLDVIPTRAEPMVLRVRAFTVGAVSATPRDTVQSDIMIDVRSAQWSVLFFDRRPSWMSTFVRRAVAQDARFRVSSRIVTSKDVSRETGSTPQGLDEVARSAEYDVVVVGAPEALTLRDVDGLTALLNARGASVVLLPDNPAMGAASGLLNIDRWKTSTPRTPANIMPFGATDSTNTPWRLRGTSIGVPARLSAQASVIGELRSSDTTSRIAQPIIWRVPTGHGTLVVSGAFDAWRYRDAAQSSFDEAWRDIIDDAASRRQRPVELRVSPALVYPHEPVAFTASLRDVAAPTADGHADSAVTIIVRPRLANPIDSTTKSRSADTALVARAIGRVEMHVGATADQRVASWRAPLAAGAYEAFVAIGPDTARTTFVVATDIARDLGAAPELMSAWAQSRGGRYLQDAQRDSLPRILSERIAAVPQRMVWHPMRSPWWIVPFALLLSYEWWIRRRRGQR